MKRVRSYIASFGGFEKVLAHILHRIYRTHLYLKLVPTEGNYCNRKCDQFLAYKPFVKIPRDSFSGFCYQ